MLKTYLINVKTDTYLGPTRVAYQDIAPQKSETPYNMATNEQDSQEMATQSFYLSPISVGTDARQYLKQEPSATVHVTPVA